MKLFKDDSKAEIDIDGIKRIYDLNCTFYNILDGNILEGVKNYFDNNMLAFSNLCLSFFNLCSSIITFYRCFEDYEKNMNIFSHRLYETYDNFERYKNEILPFKN